MTRGQSIVLMYVLGLLLGIGLVRLVEDRDIFYFGITVFLNLLWLPAELKRLHK